LILNGRTTLEATSNEISHSTSSTRKNFEAVFGNNPIYWFLPVNTNAKNGYEIERDDDDGLLPTAGRSRSSHSSSSSSHNNNNNNNGDRSVVANGDDEEELQNTKEINQTVALTPITENISITINHSSNQQNDL